MSLTQCSCPLLTICYWDLCFLWQKQQTSRGQADTGVFICGRVVLLLGY